MLKIDYKLGDYRIVEMADYFIVQCYSAVPYTVRTRHAFSWLFGPKITHEVVPTWRTVVDRTQPGTGYKNAFGVCPTIYPPVTFNSMGAAQAFIDKVRCDQSNFPRYHYDNIN